MRETSGQTTMTRRPWSKGGKPGRRSTEVVRQAKVWYVRLQDSREGRQLSMEGWSTSRRRKQGREGGSRPDPEAGRSWGEVEGSVLADKATDGQASVRWSRSGVG